MEYGSAEQAETKRDMREVLSLHHHLGDILQPDIEQVIRRGPPAYDGHRCAGHVAAACLHVYILYCLNLFR